MWENLPGFFRLRMNMAATLYVITNINTGYEMNFGNTLAIKLFYSQLTVPAVYFSNVGLFPEFLSQLTLAQVHYTLLTLCCNMWSGTQEHILLIGEDDSSTTPPSPPGGLGVKTLQQKWVQRPSPRTVWINRVEIC